MFLSGTFDKKWNYLLKYFIYPSKIKNFQNIAYWQKRWGVTHPINLLGMAL